VNFVEPFEVMFPKHDSDYTMFENPCIREFQVPIDNGNTYPEERVGSYEPKLINMVSTAAEIGPLTLGHDLLASYIEPRNLLDGTIVRMFVTRAQTSPFPLIYRGITMKECSTDISQGMG
jgi:hypothetical protein